MVGIAGAALVLLAACGRGAAGDRPPPAAKRGRPLSNWEVPLHGGRIVASAMQAARYVHFLVHEPQFASRPALIQVDDPAQVPVDDRTGRVRLPPSGRRNGRRRGAQRAPHADRAAAARGRSRRARRRLPDGPGARATQGLLVSGNGIGGLLWIEGGVLFDITGPSVSPSQVQALAALV